MKAFDVNWLLMVLMPLSATAFSHAASKDLNPQVAVFAEARIAEFNQIPDERKAELRKLALYVRTQLASNQDANLLFICTHNSRRSHIAQIWAQTAAWYYNVAPKYCSASSSWRAM